MIEYLMGAEALVYGALVFYVLGFLFRDELWLRGMLLIGTIFYVFYYYFAPSFPLWEAIATSSILGVVNIMMIGVVAMERSKFTMNSHTSFLYGHFPNLNPGQFRRLLKCGGFETADAPTVLCEEGRMLERLFFVVDGGVQITKDGRSVEIGSGHLFGELAFFGWWDGFGHRRG